MHGVQSVTLIIGFIHGQRIFTLCDCRSEGFVPGKYIEKAGKKKENIKKNIFIKIVFRARIRTPTDEEKNIIIQMLYPLSYCN